MCVSADLHPRRTESRPEQRGCFCSWAFLHTPHACSLLSLAAIQFVLQMEGALRAEDRKLLLHEVPRTSNRKTHRSFLTCLSPSQGTGSHVMTAWVEIHFDNEDGRIPIDKARRDTHPPPSVPRVPTAKSSCARSPPYTYPSLPLPTPL